MPSGLHRCKIVRLVLGVCSQSFACLHDLVYCLLLRSVCQVPSFMIALSLLHSILLTEEKTAWLTRTLTLTHLLARWILTTTCGEVRAKKNVLRMFFLLITFPEMVSGGHLTPLDLENFLEKLLLAAGEFFAGILIIMLNFIKVYSI